MQQAAVGLQLQRRKDELGVEVRKQFLSFLTEFKSAPDVIEDYADSLLDGALSSVTHYGHHVSPRRLKVLTDQVSLMIETDRTTLYVDFTHVLSYNVELAEAIEEEYARLEGFLVEAIKQVIQREKADYLYTEQQLGKAEKLFFVSFYNVQGIQKLRDLTTNKISRLLSISGTVTRSSEVRPELLKARFRCLNPECGTISGYIEQQFCYTEPRVCLGTPNKPGSCINTNKWELVASSAIFSDWQKVRLQENSKDIPGGSMPRSINVVLRNEGVDKAKAGDQCVFTGTLIVTPDISQFNLPGVKARVKPSTAGGSEGTRGLKGLGVRDLTYSMCFLASNVRLADQGHDAVNLAEDEEQDVVLQLSDQERDDILTMSQSQRIYRDLMECVAPTVHGHDEVKRGILLMLFGGVHKETPEGISLRGDINVCIVGDPSTSKSQMLKWVVKFMPRAIYTSGKASSAAGLTATVAKDPDTKEFTIEAGALMLADNGICCIDEFDKMDVKDQVAIHEAMEQQSISIAKAGIQATLNARTSVLAAANPIAGRYDKSKTLRGNLNISAPIMSRFDLFFIVLDEMDEQADYNIARHIVRVHQYRDAGVATPYTGTQLYNYIRFAKTLKPMLTEESGRILVEEYGSLRQNDVGAGGNTAYRITVRQLESLIRLSEALARLHLNPLVIPEYVREASRLLKKSIIHVETEDLVLSERLGPVRDAPLPDEELQEQQAEQEQEHDSQAARKMMISYEDYTRLTNMMVLHLRAEEDRGGAASLKRSTLEAWYLGECALETEAQLVEEARRVKLVVDRLIHKDHILMVADAPKEERRAPPPADDGDGAEELEQHHQDEELDEEDDEDDPWISVHPNYSVG